MPASVHLGVKGLLGALSLEGILVGKELSYAGSWPGLTARGVSWPWPSQGISWKPLGSLAPGRRDPCLAVERLPRQVLQP